MTGDDLDEFVAAARTGDADALTSLYRALQPALIGFLTGLSPSEAEDLAAETWIDAARCLPTLKGHGVAFRRLLFTIARRRVIDSGRQRQRRRTEPADLSDHAELATGTDPGAIVSELDSSQRAIGQIAALLSPAQAEIVLLRVVGGLTVAEVAGVVGRSPASVSVIQHRALRRLAVRMENRSRSRQESSIR